MLHVFVCIGRLQEAKKKKKTYYCIIYYMSTFKIKFVFLLKIKKRLFFHRVILCLTGNFPPYFVPPHYDRKIQLQSSPDNVDERGAEERRKRLNESKEGDYNRRKRNLQ